MLLLMFLSPPAKRRRRRLSVAELLCSHQQLFITSHPASLFHSFTPFNPSVYHPSLSFSCAPTLFSSFHSQSFTFASEFSSPLLSPSSFFVVTFLLFRTLFPSSFFPPPFLANISPPHHTLLPLTLSVYVHFRISPLPSSLSFPFSLFICHHHFSSLFWFFRRLIPVSPISSFQFILSLLLCFPSSFTFFHPFRSTFITPFWYSSHFLHYCLSYTTHSIPLPSTLHQSSLFILSDPSSFCLSSFQLWYFFLTFSFSSTAPSSFFYLHLFPLPSHPVFNLFTFLASLFSPFLYSPLSLNLVWPFFPVSSFLFAPSFSLLCSLLFLFLCYHCSIASSCFIISISANPHILHHFPSTASALTTPSLPPFSSPSICFPGHFTLSSFCSSSLLTFPTSFFLFPFPKISPYSAALIFHFWPVSFSSFLLSCCCFLSAVSLLLFYFFAFLIFLTLHSIHSIYFLRFLPSCLHLPPLLFPSPFLIFILLSWPLTRLSFFHY